jgi:hypothetical protein
MINEIVVSLKNICRHYGTPKFNKTAGPSTRFFNATLGDEKSPPEYIPHIPDGVLWVEGQ